MKVVAVKVYLQRVRLNKSKYKINVLTGSHKGIKYKYDLAEDLAQDSNPYLKIYSRQGAESINVDEKNCST